MRIGLIGVGRIGVFHASTLDVIKSTSGSAVPVLVAEVRQ